MSYGGELIISDSVFANIIIESSNQSLIHYQDSDTLCETNFLGISNTLFDNFTISKLIPNAVLGIIFTENEKLLNNLSNITMSNIKSSFFF